MRSSAAALLARAVRLRAAAPMQRLDAPTAAAAAAAASLHLAATPIDNSSSLADRITLHLWASKSSSAAATAHYSSSHDHKHDHTHPADSSSSSSSSCDTHGCTNLDHDHSHGSSSAGPASSSDSSSFEAAEATCWSCNDRHKRGSLLCQACDKIQPVDGTMTYFDLMGMCVVLLGGASRRAGTRGSVLAAPTLAADCRLPAVGGSSSVGLCSSAGHGPLPLQLS